MPDPRPRLSPRACVRAEELFPIFSTYELANSYSAHELKEAGSTLRQLQSAGFALAELHEAGFEASEFTSEAGFSAAELVSAGFTEGEVLGAGYPQKEVDLILRPKNKGKMGKGKPKAK